MTEEKPTRDPAGANTGRSRKGRRRYFQPKKDGKSQAAGNQLGSQGSEQSGRQAGQPHPSGQSTRGQDNSKRSDAPAKRGDTRSKRSAARRRARSRQRYDDSRAANLEAEVAYVPPQSVYIYEHSVHPELRDTYEFRPDHFSKVGRTLDDYQIDLSKLFPGEIADDGTPVLTNMLPKPQYDWSAWEEAASEAEQKG
jgi:hypothetical protein